MARTELFAELERKYGSHITAEGKTFFLTQQAYCDCPNGENYYQAMAIAAEDEPDEYGFQDAYEIHWGILPEYLAECEEDPESWHDESLACDWDNPESITAAVCGYSLTEKRFC